MQQRLRESYLEMGMDNDATVAPVGMAWKHSIDDNPNFELYTADEGHPNLAGSYLAACTFYCTLFQKSCVGSSYVPNGLSIGDATTLQTIASNTVLDSTWVWNMFTIQSADTTSTNDSTYSFSTTASNYDNLVWDFGDGNTSSTANASHTFGSGQHQVELSVFSNGGCLVKKETFDLEVVSANDTSSTDTTVSIFTNLSESIKLYPTPLNNYLTIEANDKRSLFKIYNMMGQLVYSKEVIGTERIDFNDLARGHYIAKIQTKDEDLTFKIFKNE
jgi:flagellar hook assembly protein FlgD